MNDSLQVNDVTPGESYDASTAYDFSTAYEAPYPLGDADWHYPEWERAPGWFIDPTDYGQDLAGFAGDTVILDEKPSWVKRHKGLLILGAVAAAVGVAWYRSR